MNSPFQNHTELYSSPALHCQSLKKRGRDEAESEVGYPSPRSCETSSNEMSPSKDYNGTSKRWQRQRIHTQVHQNTVALMMQSQKLLQEQERLARLGDGMILDCESAENEDRDELHDTKQDEYRQKPFWPVIAKPKHA